MDTPEVPAGRSEVAETGAGGQVQRSHGLREGPVCGDVDSEQEISSAGVWHVCDHGQVGVGVHALAEGPAGDGAVLAGQAGERTEARDRPCCVEHDEMDVGLTVGDLDGVEPAVARLGGEPLVSRTSRGAGTDR